ncbi:MAG TPA: hypothetical protein PLA27_12485 [Anaerolineales bacterium]|nr:hypothetical protein [Anaerolineales bacterium]HQX17235.1 hypothetical protein [Anaerolineales bacterium]
MFLFVNLMIPSPISSNAFSRQKSKEESLDVPPRLIIPESDKASTGSAQVRNPILRTTPFPAFHLPLSANHGYLHPLP